MGIQMQPPGKITKEHFICMLEKYNAHTDPLFKRAAILKKSDMLRINALTIRMTLALVSKLGLTGPELNSVTIKQDYLYPRL